MLYMYTQWLSRKNPATNLCFSYYRAGYFSDSPHTEMPTLYMYLYA